jgi:drug/metabolite transporter (DMT)-like permease
MNSELIGITAALGSAASWALGSVLFRRLGDSIPPVSLTFAKGITGAILLGIAVLMVGSAPLDTGTLTLLVLSGLLGIAVGDTLFFMALNNLGAHVVVILLTLGQLLTVMMGVLWLGETPSPSDWGGIGAILAGVTIVMWSQISGPEGRTRLIGLVYGLLAVCAMSVSIIIAKEALAKADSIQATFIRMLAGTVGIFVFGALSGQLMRGLSALRRPSMFGFFLISVAVVTFGGFWLSLLAIDHIDVSIANTLNATEPLFVLPLAAFLLKERITRIVVFGALMTFVGIVLIIGPWG